MITQNSMVTHLTKPHEWVYTTTVYVKKKFWTKKI